MKFQEDFSSIELALPRAAYLLKNLKDTITYESQHSSRNPVAAYNISLNTLGKRFLRVTESLTKIEQNFVFTKAIDQKLDFELLEATDHLLDALMEHMDVCKGIIRSFFPKTEENKFSKNLSLFKTSVEPYRRHIGKIDNYIKHNQGALRLIYFSWPTGTCFGYFVEGPINEGITGPAASIHKNSNSAFSFNRDLKFHLSSVFAVGAQLSNSLHKINNKLIIEEKIPATECDLAWIEAVSSVSKLPLMFFPDEIKKPIPIVKVTNNKVIIDTSTNKYKATQPPNLCKISLSTIGDGVTRSFKLPYMSVDE